jgi:hypothetical protein
MTTQNVAVVATVAIAITLYVLNALRGVTGKPVARISPGKRPEFSPGAYTTVCSASVPGRTVSWPLARLTVDKDHLYMRGRGRVPIGPCALERSQVTSVRGWSLLGLATVVSVRTDQGRMALWVYGTRLLDELRSAGWLP